MNALVKYLGFLYQNHNLLQLSSVILGTEDVDAKLRAIMKPIQRLPIDPTTLQEFKTFFKYLAFVASAAKAPVRQKMLQETLTRIAKAGEAENIERWCWWTPAQLSLLDQADRLTRVILIGGNGTGKTVMLDAFTAKIAKEHPDKKVTFAIHQSLPYARPLLQLDLELKYEKAKLQNVTVATFKEVSELNLTNCHTVCVDEIAMGLVKPEDLHAIRSNSLWIVIRETNRLGENHEEYLRQIFPGWVIVNLSYPLRTSRNLSDKIKNEEVYDRTHTNNFNESLKVAPNMPLGPNPLILLKAEGSYYTRLQKAFSVLGIDKSALIILDSSMRPTFEEIQAVKATYTNHELADNTAVYICVGIEAVKACRRPQGPPLMWFRSDYANVSDGKASIKEWMKGKNRNISGRDLLTESMCVPGYEADLVIYLGIDDVSAYMSRCRGQFVQIE